MGPPINVSYVCSYTMPKKIQLIRIQESRCIFDDITLDLPIVRRAYFPLILLATEFSMAWYKIVTQICLVIYHRMSNLSIVFLGVHTNFQGVKAVKITPKVEFN